MGGGSRTYTLYATKPALLRMECSSDLVPRNAPCPMQSHAESNRNVIYLYESVDADGGKLINNFAIILFISMLIRIQFCSMDIVTGLSTRVIYD